MSLDTSKYYLLFQPLYLCYVQIRPVGRCMCRAQGNFRLSDYKVFKSVEAYYKKNENHPMGIQADSSSLGHF